MSILCLLVGGGGVLADQNSDVIPFDSMVDVSESSVVTSSYFAVSGISGPSPVSIGSEVGEYRINAGAWTSSPGTISPGDLVAVRLTSSAAFYTTVSVGLLIGSTLSTFSARTRFNPAQDEFFSSVAYLNFFNNNTTALLKGSLFTAVAGVSFSGNITQTTTTSYAEGNQPNVGLMGGDLTVEGTVTFTGSLPIGRCAFTYGGNSNSGISLWTATGSKMEVRIGNTSQIVSTASVSQGTWINYAITRVNNVLRFYLNGNLQGTKTGVTAIVGSEANVLCMNNSSARNVGFNGGSDHFRITKGVGRYTGPSYSVSGFKTS